MTRGICSGDITVTASDKAPWKVSAVLIPAGRSSL
jgi:hypothetical protein